MLTGQNRLRSPELLNCCFCYKNPAMFNMGWAAHFPFVVRIMSFFCPFRHKEGSVRRDALDLRGVVWSAQFQDIVVSVARKTDAQMWPALFSAVGPPSKLLDDLLGAGQLTSAACCLLIVDRIEGAAAAHTFAVRLVEVGRFSLLPLHSTNCVSLLGFLSYTRGVRWMCGHALRSGHKHKSAPHLLLGTLRFGLPSLAFAIYTARALPRQMAGILLAQH